MVRQLVYYGFFIALSAAIHWAAIAPPFRALAWRRAAAATTTPAAPGEAPGAPAEAPVRPGVTPVEWNDRSAPSKPRAPGAWRRFAPPPELEDPASGPIRGTRGGRMRLG